MDDSTLPTQEQLQAARRRAAAQRVRIRSDHAHGRYVTTSRSDHSVTYFLQVDDEGSIICNCPGFHHHGFCKHATQLAAQLQRKQRQLERL